VQVAKCPADRGAVVNPPERRALWNDDVLHDTLPQEFWEPVTECGFGVGIGVGATQDGTRWIQLHLGCILRKWGCRHPAVPDSVLLETRMRGENAPRWRNITTRKQNMAAAMKLLGVDSNSLGKCRYMLRVVPPWCASGHRHSLPASSYQPFELHPEFELEIALSCRLRSDRRRK
jgi:hypothetical protein